MASIRSTGTRPEMIVRSVAHRLGYRFRLHGKGLPGRPDLVFKGRKKVIFVHGCFWHRHTCKTGRKAPKSNTAYWLPKLRRNRLRDIENQKKLRALGWGVLVIWECELERVDSVIKKLISFLE